MGSLREYRNLSIDWEMTPEDAVTLYLEWGNHPWNGKFMPVTSKADVTNYFVVYTWDERPKVLLIRRNSEEARELWESELPENLARTFLKSHGALKGVFAVNPEIRQWLEDQIAN